MTISNKRKKTYKFKYINHMTNIRTSYKVTGSKVIEFEDITNYDNKEQEKT